MSENSKKSILIKIGFVFVSDFTSHLCNSFVNQEHQIFNFYAHKLNEIKTKNCEKKLKIKNKFGIFRKTNKM